MAIKLGQGSWVNAKDIKKMFLYYSSSSGSVLPSAYKQVGYIYSTSSWPYIDTGVIPTGTTKSQIWVKNLASTWSVIYGYDAPDNNDFRLFNYSSSCYFDYSSSRLSGGTFSAWTQYNLEIGNYYVKNLDTGTNIVSTTSISSSWTWVDNIYLNWKSTISRNEWYYVKIWENDVQIRNMLPCYRKSDNVVWMYDTINDVFYTNAGSGSFLYGETVVEQKIWHVYKGTQQIRPLVIPPRPTSPTYEVDFMQGSLPSGWTWGSVDSLGLNGTSRYTIQETDLTNRKVILEFDHYEWWNTWNVESQNLSTGLSWTNFNYPWIYNTIQGYPGIRRWGYTEMGYSTNGNSNNFTAIEDVYNGYSAWVFYTRIEFDFSTWAWAVYATDGSKGTWNVTAIQTGNVNQTTLNTIINIFSNQTIYWGYKHAWSGSSRTQRWALTIQ